MLKSKHHRVNWFSCKRHPERAATSAAGDPMLPDRLRDPFNLARGAMTDKTVNARQKGLADTCPFRVKDACQINGVGKRLECTLTRMPSYLKQARKLDHDCLEP